MTQLEVMRLIAEVLGIIGFVGGVGWYIVRQIWRVLREVEAAKDEIKEAKVEMRALKDHQASMNGKVGDHTAKDTAEFAEIRIRLARIEGRLNLPAQVEMPAVGAME